MNKQKNKTNMKKLYRRGGRVRYYANGGMYSSNVIPGSMIPDTNTASYEQVNQAQIDASNRQLAQVQAQPWQQKFAEQQQQDLVANQALTQTANQGMGMINDRLSSGKSFFGKNAQELASSQGFTDTIVDGAVTETAASKAGNQAGNIGTAGVVADYAGQGISALSNDDDATTMNVGETSGTILSGAGKGAATGATIGSIIPGVGTAIGAGVGAVVGGISSGLKGRKARNEAREMEEEEEMKRAQAEQGKFEGAMAGKSYSGSNMGQLKQGGYRNFYMGGGPLNYAGEGLNNKSPNMYKGGGFDFNVNQERQRVKDYNAPGGTADQYEKIHNTPWSEQLDNIQTGLTVGGMSPGVGIFADAGNTLISGARTLTNALSGNFANAKKHLFNTGVNALTMIPAIGQTVGGTKLLTQSAKQLNNIKKASNTSDFVKAVGVNTTGVINNAIKGNPQYMSKLLGKTTNLEKSFDFVPETNARPITGPNLDPRFNQIDTGGAGGQNNINPVLQQLAFNQQNNSARTGGLYNKYGHGGMQSKSLDGGIAKPLQGGAIEFIGKKHEQGGIKLDPKTEVEGGETMDKVQGNDYFFSSYLKLGGKSFAERHKDILAKGGKQEDIERLASIQEKSAGRDKYNLGGEKEKQKGGVRKYQDAGFANKTQKELDIEAKRIWENPSGDHWNWNDERRAEHKAYHFNEDGTPTTDAQKAAWKTERGIGSNNTSNNGRLYNNVQDSDVADYLDEARTLTGIQDFNPRNPEHTAALQTVLKSPTQELLDKYPDYFSGKETDILEGDLGVNKQGIDSKFGIDTLNALKEVSESVDDPLTKEILDETDLIKPKPTVEGCPCEDGTMSEACCGENEEVKTNKGRGLFKSIGKNAIPIIGAGLQLLPAYMAYKEKPDYMSSPGRLPTTHLDRVRFNAEREQNEGNYRGMGRAIEQSGAGPAGIAAKMAAWGKKTTQDNAIGSQEAKQNALIQAQESQINQRSQEANIKNSMYTNEFNAAADAANKDRRLMAVQSGVLGLAGMGKDVLNYRAVNDVARATAGNTNVLDNFYVHELEFENANSDMVGKKGNPEYSAAFLKYLKDKQNPQVTRKGGYRNFYRRGGKLKMLKKC